MRSISPKVTAATLVAALLTLGVTIAAHFGVTIDAPAQGALTIIGVFIAGYLKLDPARS
jgi:hypothetical protein